MNKEQIKRFEERFRHPDGQWHLAGQSDELKSFIFELIKGTREECAQMIDDMRTYTSVDANNALKDGVDHIRSLNKPNP